MRERSGTILLVFFFVVCGMEPIAGVECFASFAVRQTILLLSYILPLGKIAIIAK